MTPIHDDDSRREMQAERRERLAGEATKRRCIALGHTPNEQIVTPHGQTKKVRITNCPRCLWYETEDAP